MEWFPYDKSKRYLTGIDWIVNALDYRAKQATGRGNCSQLVLEVDGDLAAGPLRQKLAVFLGAYPVLSGRPQRDTNLCPYWKIDRAVVPALWWQSERATGPALVLTRLYAFANAALPEGQYLNFYLITGAAKSFLAVKFDHRLFDAAGAEAFLSLFEDYGLTQKTASIEPVLKPGLCAWGDKFKAGQSVNRFFLKLHKDLKPVTFAQAQTGEGFEFVPLFFSAEETQAIYARALAAAGYLMFMPFALAKTLQSINRTFERQGDYIVPVNVNLRLAPGAENIFFNHLSFLFFRVAAADVDDTTQLCRALSLQLYDQTKEKISRCLSQAAGLMRIVPLPVLAALLDKFMGGDSASFAFSYLAESAYRQKTFCGHKIVNIFHLPLVPPKPGVGIFFTRYAERLNVTLSYARGTLEEGLARRLADDLKAGLLSDVRS